MSGPVRIVMSPVRSVVRAIIAAKDAHWYSDQTIEDAYSELDRLHIETLRCEAVPALFDLLVRSNRPVKFTYSQIMKKGDEYRDGVAALLDGAGKRE